MLLKHYQWFLVVIWLDAADEVRLALLKDFHQFFQGLLELSSQSREPFGGIQALGRVSTC